MSLMYRDDDRSAEPDEGQQRAFHTGWDDAARKEYRAATLETLTWQNLGYRLGKLLGEAPPELRDELYAACARILAWQNNKR
jgi:hypothetical protein